MVCIQLLLENGVTELVLKNIEVLIDRKTKLGHNVRYNMRCMGSYLYSLTIAHCTDNAPQHPHPLTHHIYPQLCCSPQSCLDVMCVSLRKMTRIIIKLLIYNNSLK